MLPRAARVRHLETGLYPTAACGTLCRLEVGYISSPDGGAHWGPATQLAGPMAPSQIALTSQGPMVGDYISTSFTGGLATTLLAVGLQQPTSTTFDEAMYAPRSRLGWQPRRRPLSRQPPRASWFRSPVWDRGHPANAAPGVGQRYSWPERARHARRVASCRRARACPRPRRSARGGPLRAPKLLRLCAVIANGDFAEYWRWHEQQELRRNHLDHFQQLDLAA